MHLLRGIILGVGLVGLSACASAPPANDEVDQSFKTALGIEPVTDFDTRIRKADAYPLGDAKNPVRVNSPAGQREYLSRLRCENGQPPAFHRVGSFGLGPYENIIDGYEVTCSGSQPEKTMIYMDMYFLKHIETRAVEGFTRVTPPINWPDPNKRPEVTMPPVPK
ncbi:hypothetical protein [Asticcacaulis tiandongensis]|uniref:hypothetical protein n=1 Tax=Asticcacaulis tiandongensis TaxID=2565365 RepID=UPI001125D440|nr:hypothetical protein [Asticcacaulis tiandongensis]